jgi:transposase-like protein
LRSADVGAWLAERGVRVDAGAVERSFQRVLPLFGDAARVPRHPVGAPWRVDALDTL